VPLDAWFPELPPAGDPLNPELCPDVAAAPDTAPDPPDALELEPHPDANAHRTNADVTCAAYEKDA
jgi:hypothetical protein